MTQKNRNRRYNVYKKGLEKLGIELPDLKRPTKQSVRNAQQMWRKARATLQDMGINLPNIDRMASGKISKEEIDKLKELAEIREIEEIISELESEINFITHKDSKLGQEAVRKAAQRIKDMIDAALEKWGPSETLRRLKIWAGGVKLVDLMHKLATAIYDEDYRYTKDRSGVAAWERKLASLARILEVEDTWAGIF